MDRIKKIKSFQVQETQEVDFISIQYSTKLDEAICNNQILYLKKSVKMVKDKIRLSNCFI